MHVHNSVYGDFDVLVDKDIEDYINKNNIKIYVKRDKANLFYAVFWNKVNGKLYKQLLHRWIVNAPKDKIVDHINHNSLDNRRCNLRICTHFENNANTLRNTSGITGVYFRKDIKKWAAYIKINQKRIHLGCYKNKEEAARIRREYFNRVVLKQKENNVW